MPLIRNEVLYKATDPSNAWLGFDLALQGSGQLRFDVDVKSTQKITVGAFVNQATSGRWSQFVLPNCQVQTQWSTCKFQVTLESRAFTSVYLGGNNTWRLGSTDLLIRNVKYEVIDLPQVIEYLIPQTRVKGLSFNENGFGAWMALLGLLALIAHRTLLSRVSAGAALLGVVLSGSQGALGALMFGGMVLMLWNLRSGKWLLLLISLLAMFFVSTRFLATNNAVLSTPVQQLQPTIRVLRTTPTESIQTRLELWRLATKAWLENPRTFLIGTGDLTTAMKAKFDARSSSFGLTKDSLTHAHNLWIQTAGESGLLGLCAMMWLWGWVILRAWRSRDAGALALLAAIFVINSVDYLFFYAPVHLAFWMAAAGLKRPEPTSVPPEGSAVLTP